MYKETFLPQITLKWAQTLDGQLADDRDQSQWISGVEDRRYTHQLRSTHQAILVGAQTFLKDQCQLTVRDIAYNGPQPVRVIIDPRGRVLQKIRNDKNQISVLQSGPRKTFLLTDILEEFDDIESLFDTQKLVHVRYRFKEMKHWLVNSLLQLSAVFESCEHRRLQFVMVEGGASIISEFLKAGLAHRLEVAISPMILGGRRHRVSTGTLLSSTNRFEVDSKEQLGADILLRYRVSSRETFQGVRT